MTNWLLRIGQASEAGRVRKHNEDQVECFVPQDEALLESKGDLFLVADGMGGHQAGGVASHDAVKWVKQKYYADTSHDVGDSLARAFKVANQAIFKRARADLSLGGMGTTLVAAVILGKTLYVANVGDSRAYLFRRKRLRQITLDHSWVEEQVQTGALSREQAEMHPQRNLITRALGTRPEVEVDLFQMELQDGDVLLLCTDGLSGQVSEQRMAESIRTMPPPQAVADLVAEANEQGGRDNVSVAIVQIGSHPEEPGLQRVLGPVRRMEPRRRLVLGLVALIFVCLCALIAIFPAVNQRLVGDPAAAPQMAPIRFDDLTDDNLVDLADYLHYADFYEMRAANPGQLNQPFPPVADLWPSGPGLFLVGLVRDWYCQEGKCTFQLEMAGTLYDIELDQTAFVGDPLSLNGQRVRVFGQLPAEGTVLKAHLIDLGARWWAWWQPAWITVYQDHDWGRGDWVFGIADHNPYSPVDIEQYAGLEQGGRILIRGRWLKSGSQDSMTFAPDDVYHLHGDVYVLLSDDPTPTSQPTVTLQPTASP